MLAFSASTITTVPIQTPVQTRGRCKGQTTQPVYGFVRLTRQPLDTRRLLSRCSSKQSASVVCASGTNARCSTSGQTQTVLREAPTITKAPVREPTKTPEIDDGGSGLPPRDDGGGGGGGGGGGNWSGGFFFFGFLAFLGFLKDKESEDEYGDSRR